MLTLIVLLGSFGLSFYVWSTNLQVVTAPASITTKIEGKENIPNYDWVTGNVKGWQEGDWVPYACEISNGESVAVTFTVPIEHDHFQGTYYGLNGIRNSLVYRDTVSEPALIDPVYYVPTTWSSGNQQMVYDWTITIGPGETCRLETEVQIQPGAINWPGATIHTTIGAISTVPEVNVPSGVKTIPIMVEASPSIEIIKYVGTSATGPWEDANLGEALDIDFIWESPSDIYYKFVVTNTGNVPLGGTEISDTLYDVSGASPDDPLQPGNSYEYIIGPYPVQDGTVTNTASVSATYKGDPVEDDDPAYYRGFYASITVTKVTEPGSSIVFDYTDYDSNPFPLRDYNTEGDVKVFWLLPGSYTFEELAETGWDLDDISITGDVDSGSIKDLENRKLTVDLDRGETISVWFTNIERGSIIIEKQTLPDGRTKTFDFTGAVTGTIGDDEQIVVANLIPGEYIVTESVESLWSLTSINVDDGGSLTPSVVDLGSRKVTINLDEGETVTVVFTNTKEEEDIDPWSAKIKVRKEDSLGKPIEGWMISLFQIDKYTDSDGYVVFNIGEPQTYTLIEETRTGWIPLGETTVQISVTEEKTYEYTFRNQKVPEFAVPEYPLGTILSILTMISALVISQNKHKIHL